MGKIKIGGEERIIKFNFNALAEFEDLTGVNALNGLNSITAKNTRALVYCALKAGAYPDKFIPSIEEVGDWLSISDGSLTSAMEAFRDSITKPEKNQGGE